jgi:hypothetical protein
MQSCFRSLPTINASKSVLNQIAVEYEQATVNKQMDLAKAITLKHQAEIEEAKQSYEASRKKPD